MQQLVTYLNGQNGYRATIDRYGAALLPTTEVDAVAGANIRTLPALTIQYVGAGAACTMNITNTALTTTVTGGPGGQNLNLDLTALATDTLGELVAVIAAQTGAYACTLGPNADPEAACPSLLTDVTGQDIRTGQYVVDGPGRPDGLRGARRCWGASSTPSLPACHGSPPAACPLPPPPRPTWPRPSLRVARTPCRPRRDWLNGLEVIEQEDLVGGLLFPVTTNPIFQDAINAWCSEQHTNACKSFRGFYAPPDNTSRHRMPRAWRMGLNSTFAAMIPQAMVAASGVTEQPPLYPTACYCGAAAGALPTQPVTRLVVRARALPARAKLSKAVREDLLANGVAVLEEVKGVGVRVSLAVTTSLSSDRIDRVLSESMARDVIEQRVRAYLEPLIPHWAMTDFLPTVKGSVYNALS